MCKYSREEWERWEEKCEADLVHEFGAEWRREHDLEIHEYDTYYCRWCGKVLKDLNTVKLHLQSQKHKKNHYHFFVKPQDPLAGIPEAERECVFVDVDFKVKCRICNNEPECSLEHLGSKEHEFPFLYRFHKTNHKRSKTREKFKIKSNHY